MATVKKQQPAAAQRTPAKPLFTKDNYMWMLAGIVVMTIGFLLMAGGKNADPTKFEDSVTYSVQRITVAPILIMAGFVIEIFAIMRKPKGE